MTRMEDPKDFYYKIIDSFLEKYTKSEKITRIDRINYYVAKREIAFINAADTLNGQERRWFWEEADLCSYALETEFRGLGHRISKKRSMERVLV